MNGLRSWKEEKQSAYLYGILARRESRPEIAALFQKLAGEAEKQAGIWAEQLKSEGLPPPPPYRPDLRARSVAALVERFEPHRLKPVLAAMKIRGLSAYSKALPGHPMPTDVAQVGRRHRGPGVTGNLRAAVFGVNDGLVSNASLIMGIAGASNDKLFILLSGIAGLLAGAFSMGAGEYISVTSQREMFEHQIDLEKKELQAYPEQETEELALIYQAKGLTQEEARDLARKIIANPDRALDTLAREELGLNIEELGSPWGAAIFSFLAFSGGAVIPLLPFLFSRHPHGLWVSVGLTACALFGVGATLSLFTGRRAVWSGLRMLLIGGSAGAATFLIGKLLGVTLS
ncbi:MAG: VIT1/CCC1 transporter family protein [Deltaproteobacteria bacterium]|nr:VIT1/CCC1 transporter family protein [Deltaproteobacteria bacterium]